ncbi:inversin isoform X10 [Varanus komodoensis]|uniref:inversin isoform X10 n=1 Tax=Varanus komodoensis TaxID=61221 RepID=UPI001CF7D64B|nr:inversin isoform X10 [Varanus komodoensis]
MNVSETWLFSGSPLASQVHAFAVNGHKSALLKQIAGNPDLKDKEDQFGRTPLMYCVLADRLDCAEALLKTGTDVNKADNSQRTALHLAAQKGNYRFMKLLLARRANWMKKDLEEITPLHLTTRHKSPKCLALLLKYMAPGEVDTQDKNKQTALHWSAYYNNPEHVKLLIKHDSNIGIPDIEGKIPLHWAANHKDPSAVHTVKCILDAAPTESLLNWQDYEGRTPLHFAVADGNVAVVDLLTSYEGCNVTSYDNLFRTPLHWAALLGHAQIVHLLLERNKVRTIPSDSQGATPLHYAAQSNFAETVEAFLKHPSVKDDSDLEGRTSFMWAAGKGSDDVIQTMLNLKLDIDINMADKYGGTALHAAALSGHVSTVQLLLKHEAQVDATDVMKHTPLFRACEMGHKEVIQTLIKGGARVDLVDQDGHSPLHWAALGGNTDVCQILIENKINPNVQDYAGRTPLQCAAYGGYINCMVVLLENNADPNIQDKEGRTALHWLCNNGYLDAIKLLLGFGAFPNHMENHEERKREEENRRKATELQKEQQNCKTDRAQAQHQELSEAERSHTRLHTPQCPVRHGGKTPSGSRSQSQRDKSKNNAATVLPNKVTPNNQCHSTELLEDHKQKSEVSRAKSKRKSAGIPSHSRKSNDGPQHQVEVKHQVLSATSGRDDKKHEEPIARTNGTFRPARKRHDSNSKAASSVEKSENLSQPMNNDMNHFEETPACIQKSNCTNRSTRNSRQYELALRSNPQQPKARSKEMNDERWSSAGSSRPGSAQVARMSTAAATQINKVAASKACPLLANNARTMRLMFYRMEVDSGHGRNAKPDRQVLMSSRDLEDRLDLDQCRGIEPIPLEIRMQIIEKERARKELFHKKNCAAYIIQRAWRSYQLKKQFLKLFSVKQLCKKDEEKWRQKVAAFCIEVTWNKRLNQTPLKTVISSKNAKSMNKSNSGVTSTPKPSTLKQIYGRSQEGRVYHPVRPPSSNYKVCELQTLAAFRNTLHQKGIFHRRLVEKFLRRTSLKQLHLRHLSTCVKSVGLY